MMGPVAFASNACHAAERDDACSVSDALEACRRLVYFGKGHALSSDHLIKALKVAEAKETYLSSKRDLS